MDASGAEEEVVSKEVLLKVLLDELVDPHLPINIPPGNPPIHKQKSVAKQLHCVVLLYNYYHRKQYPQVEYLDFESFCQLVVTLKPVLAWHMNCKSESDSVELNDSENQFSITEKAIQDACNLSVMLDATKAIPVIEGWKISKVSVLLLDSKENCCLKFGSVNDGVWSVLEKDLDVSANDSKLEEGKHVNKRRRVAKKLLTSEQKYSDSNLQRLAFLAVQDATGIRRSDLVVLEKHVVYSLSKAKTTACFYIIQCSKPTSQDVLIPLKEVVKSLQGPLVVNRSGWWFTTPVVEYFHLLPYAAILSAWHLRDKIPSSLQNSASRSPKDAGNTSETVVSGSELASPNMGDTSIKKSVFSDNNCSDMVCGTNENCDWSTNHAKSSGKEVGSEIASLNVEETSTKMSDCSDNYCSNMVIEINENYDKSTNNAKSSGKEVGNEIASLEVEETSIEMSDCLDNSCSSIVCELKENSDRSTSSAKSSGKVVENETASLKIEGTDVDGNMVCEINENYDRSTKHAKSSGKEVSGSASSQRIDEKKVDERESFNGSYFIKDKSIDGDHRSISECADSKVEEANAIKDTMKEVAGFNNSNKICHGTSFTGNELNNAVMESTELVNICHGQTNDATDVGVSETELAGKVMFSASKEKSSTQTALGALYKKKEILCNKKRHIEDMIALHDKSIERILDGQEDDMTVEIKMIKEFCDELRSNVTHTDKVQHQHFVDLGSLLRVNSSRKLESLAVSLRPAAQDLDVICCANNWKLPEYIVSSTRGGYRLKVVVRGASFECSCEGDVHSDSLEAKESAAAKMILRLQTMADMVLVSLN